MKNNELMIHSNEGLLDEDKIMEMIDSLKDKSYVEVFDSSLGKKINLISNVMYEIISEIRINQANNLGENLTKMLALRNDFLSSLVRLGECASYIRECALEIWQKQLAIEASVSLKNVSSKSSLPIRIDERSKLLAGSFLILQQMYAICCLLIKKYDHQSLQLEASMDIGAKKLQKRIKYGTKNLDKLMKSFIDKLDKN